MAVLRISYVVEREDNMNIIEQIKELRKLSEDIKFVPSLRKIFSEAADTIESLSAKLQEANTEQSAELEKVWRYCKECKYYTPLKPGVRGGARGHCEKRYPRDSRRGCTRACKMFSEKDNANEP